MEIHDFAFFNIITQSWMFEEKKQTVRFPKTATVRERALKYHIMEEIWIRIAFLFHLKNAFRFLCVNY